MSIIADLVEIQYLRRRVEYERACIDELYTIMYGTTKPIRETVQSTPAINDKLEGLMDKAEPHIQRRRALLMEIEERIAAVDRAVNTLPAKHAEIIRLHYYQGMKWEDVGKAAHYSVRRCMQIHKEAFELLRRMKECTTLHAKTV